MTWFEPEGIQWTYASRDLAKVRLISLAAFAVPVLVALVVLALITDQSWIWIPFAIVAAFVLWFGWLLTWQVRFHAWAEREDDLLVKRGRLFQKITVVPYGRMQYVEVGSGPIARSFGLASVQLFTAAVGTDASISGVPAEEAARLRDRLASRGESRLAGL